MYEEIGFVYLWYDTIKKRYYVGSHWGYLDDGYICSSRWMLNAYQKRPNSFKKRILTIITNRENLLKEEQRWLSMIKPEELRTKYYNINLDVLNPWWNDKDQRLSIGEKISKSKKGKLAGPCSPEKAKRISNAKKANFEKRRQKYGFAFTPEHSQKIAENNKNRKHTEESKQANSERMKKLWADPNYHNPGNLGNPQSEYQKQRVSQALKDKPKSEEHCINIGLASKKAWDEGKYANRKSNNAKELFWWNNGIRNTRAKTCPDGFIKGKLKRSFIS